MCGIAGIISSHPLKSEEEDHSSLIQRLHKMTNALKHRGPDGEGFWINPSGIAGFGHRRLSIIDLSDAAAQPMHYLNRYSIVHNGEIYNYIELKEELRKKGYSFNNHSDTEVILAAYDHWKDECIDQFDGMFAFAIWDEQEKELFAARDRFGEKPFFYYFDQQQFVFGSEMKALWAAGMERIPNQKMLFNFITIGYTDNPGKPEETFFENIRKLPPASFLKYKTANNELILEKYWDIDPEEQNDKISDEEAIEQFYHLFSASVKRRLRSDVSIGTSLSGGLDSSSVIAVINELQAINYSQNPADKPNTFTATFSGFSKDESSYAKLIADKYKLQQFTVDVTVEGFLQDWEKLFYQHEEPIGSASIYAQYKVFELAKQNNIKVLLDGQGADETLAGYHKYYKWYWQELFRKGKLRQSNEIKAARQIGVQENFGVKNIIAAYFPDFSTVLLEHQYLLKAIKHEGLTKDFVKRQSRDAYYTTPPHFNLNGVLYFNTCIHGLEELLRYADRNSMAHGREIRLPFLDHELVEFIFSLPAHLKIRKGWTKWLLRKTMEKKLPDNITWRKDKIGFEPPQKEWMQSKGLQELIHEAKRKLVNEKILKPEVMNTPILAMNSYDADNYDWRYLSAATYL